MVFLLFYYSGHYLTVVWESGPYKSGYCLEQVGSDQGLIKASSLSRHASIVICGGFAWNRKDIDQRSGRGVLQLYLQYLRDR